MLGEEQMVKQLEEAGFSHNQAEAILSVISEVRDDIDLDVQCACDDVRDEISDEVDDKIKQAFDERKQAQEERGSSGVACEGP